MVCLRAAVSRTPPFFSYTQFNPHLKFRSSSVKMSSSSFSNPPSQIIEHIVLFKVKPAAEPAAVNAMIANLNGLISLDPVLHISAGPVTQTRSKTLNFTHLLHSRYGSKSDLVTYTDHPEHVGVVANHVKPVVDDVMAVDWVADEFTGPVRVSPGSIVRLTALKLKEEGKRNEVLGVLRGIKEKFDSIGQLTVGENFSPGRAKGYSICSITVFNGVEDLQSLDLDKAEEEKEKVREFVEEVLVVDFAVGAAAVQTASL